MSDEEASIAKAMERRSFNGLRTRIALLPDANGITANRKRNLLHKALKYGKDQDKLPVVVNALLKQGCSMEARDERDKTPYDVAVKHGTAEAVRNVLEENGLVINELMKQSVTKPKPKTDGENEDGCIVV
jgi:ankyrin repeat protein